VTLNRIMAIILHYFTKCSSSGAKYTTVVEVAPIMSATKCRI